ncbi:MFS general substrate transporter [Backusella circina FSU 941]|nr:MFS general substrate transporter [Backusella circina FSU 941]
MSHITADRIIQHDLNSDIHYEGGIRLAEQNYNEAFHSYIEEDKNQHDGGYGWFVVLGAFFVQMTCFGIATSWGIMQDYYQQNFFSDMPNVTLYLSFVGSLFLVGLDLASPIAQIIISVWGIRLVLFLGTLFIVLGLELASFSTQIWHLYLTQGIIFGVGTSFNYVAVMYATPQWFSRRRGLAFGIISGGAGVGGLVVPFIMNAAITNLGHEWAFRILGFVCLGCNAVACCFVKERLLTEKPKTKLSQIIRFDSLKNTNFVLFLVGSDIGLFGYFVPYFILPSHATFLGLSSSQGTALIAVTSASTFVGRIIIGWLSDKIGMINTDIVAKIITSLSCLLIWNFANSYGTLMAFAVIFGLTSGSYYSMLSSIPAYLVGLEKLPSALSILLVSNVISEFGTNIASAIDSNVSTSPFFTYKMFTGVVYLVSSLFLIVLRLRVNKRLFVKV